MLDTLPPLPLPAEELKHMIGEYQALQRHSPSLRASLTRVSAAMDAFPPLALQSVAWQLAAAADGAPDASRPFQYAVITLTTTLPPAMANDRAAMRQTVNGFVIALKDRAETAVSVDKPALAAASAKTIRHHGDDAFSPREAPAFSFRIAQKLP